MKPSIRSSASHFAGIFLLWFLFAAFAEISTAQGQSAAGIQPAFLNEFINNSCLQHASVGVLVIDAESGEVEMEHQPDLTLVPASLQKLLVSAAALQTFAASYTFETQLLYQGVIDSAGTLHGDVILRGGGDPTFGSSRFATHYGDVMQRLAAALLQAGIALVDGNIVADASLFGSSQLTGTWIWEDIGNYYGAAPCGLNYLDNSYEITFATRAAGTAAEIVKTTPKLPDITFRNSVMAGGSGDEAYIYGSYLTNIREVRGTLPPYRKAFTIRGALPDPALVAATQLWAAVGKSGIAVNGIARSEYQQQDSINEQVLLKIASPSLTEIIHELNLNSINLYAETLLLHLAISADKAPEIKMGCEVLKKFWKEKGMDTDGLFMEDGSGLSRTNGITAHQFAFVLREAINSENGDIFLTSLPLAGRSGTLRYFGDGTPIEGKWRAKTGNMSRVTGHAGLLTDAAGRNKIVVVMVNNFVCTRMELQRKIERLLVGIYENE
ncbi:MAG TPA: D-alanyl-D-alanine carboxypeptidase/D-alanyl-D-alanine-endopeptidase [Bacteroidales bacterium]|nr:D-alanyl-D-alanine carboxypeptidase/D-alanyl-D-alanine-endopeptidase [Bacteroidales bacterium]